MDIVKSQRFCRLFDIYGTLLTNTRQEVLDMYLNNDLSITEIAEIKNISRQAVFDNITKALEMLEDFELKLQMINKRESCKQLLIELDTKLYNNNLCQYSKDIKIIIDKL